MEQDPQGQQDQRDRQEVMEMMAQQDQQDLRDQVVDQDQQDLQALRDLRDQVGDQDQPDHCHVAWSDRAGPGPLPGLGWLDSFDSKREKQSGNRHAAPQCVILLYRWNRLGLAGSPG